VLALKCQHAKNGGYDAPDGRWAALEDQMAAADFEPEPSKIDTAKLAAAINTRLDTPVTATPTPSSSPSPNLDPDPDPDPNANQVTATEYPDLSPEEFPAAVIAHALDQLEFKQKGI
jgi:hypothetical protein